MSYILEILDTYVSLEVCFSLICFLSKSNDSYCFCVSNAHFTKTQEDFLLLGWDSPSYIIMFLSNSWDIHWKSVSHKQIINLVESHPCVKSTFSKCIITLKDGKGWNNYKRWGQKLGWFIHNTIFVHRFLTKTEPALWSLTKLFHLQFRMHLAYYAQQLALWISCEW
jgi:hypothetical protein